MDRLCRCKVRGNSIGKRLEGEHNYGDDRKRNSNQYCGFHDRLKPQSLAACRQSIT